MTARIDTKTTGNLSLIHICMIRFVLPTMITQFFLAVFKTVDDGLFVTNYVGTNALSAINIIFPLGMLMGGLAMIFASGGSTVCARKMGEGRQEEAQRRCV